MADQCFPIASTGHRRAGGRGDAPPRCATRSGAAARVGAAFSALPNRDFTARLRAQLERRRDR
jgi:hypothetical protein